MVWLLNKLPQWIGNRNHLIRRNHDNPGEIDTKSHKVDSWERRFLVWTGKYKSISEVPDFVSQTVMERTRNRMRIKIANYMMAATAVGCFVMVYLGKEDAKRGDSVEKANIEWHRKYNEQKNQEEAEKNKKQ